MTDKSEAVAWMYRHALTPSLCHIVQARWSPDMAAGWTETALYPEPPAQPDASALVEAIVEAALDVANVVSHDGYYEIDRDAAVRAALSAWEAQHG